jgi:hypothetical protein
MTPRMKLKMPTTTKNSMSDTIYTNPAPVRLHRYRKSHRRFDYYPSSDVEDIIAHYLENGSEKCIAGILDGLIRAGHRAVSGNGGNR